MLLSPDGECGQLINADSRIVTPGILHVVILVEQIEPSLLRVGGGGGGGAHVQSDPLYQQ